MRVLVVSTLYPPVVVGGYEVECRDVVEHLRRSGHEVAVLTSDRDRATCPPDPSVLRALPFVRQDPRDTARAPVDALRAVRVVRRALERLRPDLVYVWNGHSIPFAALAEVQRRRVPLAFRICEHWFGHTWSSDPFTRHLRGEHRGARAAWAAALRAVDALPALRLRTIAPAPAAICWNSRYLEGAVPTPPWVQPVHEAVVIPSVARVDSLDGLPRAPADPPELLFVGRVDALKGPEVAVRAVEALERRHGIAASLVVVGPQDEAHAVLVREEADRLGLGGRVTLTGPLQGEALRERLTRAAAWVMPALWEEPAPLTCVEAALARVPAVCSRVGGIPEVLREETEALFFARGDHEGCADALARTLRGDGVAERLDAAHARGRELSYGPYLAGMDRFLDDAAAALGVR